MDARIMMLGVPGCGKSTVIKRTLERYDHITLVGFGDVMMEWLANEGIDRDEIRAMPVHAQMALGLKASYRVRERCKGLSLIDTHATVLSPAGYVPGMRVPVLEVLEPSAIVIVEAPPAQIALRREKDTSRRRDSQNLAAIAEHQEINRAYAVTAGTLLSAPFMLLHNDEGQIESCVDKLGELLGQLGT